MLINLDGFEKKTLKFEIVSEFIYLFIYFKLLNSLETLILQVT